MRSPAPCTAARAHQHQVRFILCAGCLTPKSKEAGNKQWHFFYGTHVKRKRRKTVITYCTDHPCFWCHWLFRSYRSWERTSGRRRVSSCAHPPWGGCSCAHAAPPRQTTRSWRPSGRVRPCGSHGRPQAKPNTGAGAAAAAKGRTDGTRLRHP